MKLKYSIASVAALIFALVGLNSFAEDNPSDKSPPAKTHPSKQGTKHSHPKDAKGVSGAVSSDTQDTQQKGDSDKSKVHLHPRDGK